MVYNKIICEHMSGKLLCIKGFNAMEDNYGGEKIQCYT